MDTHEAVEQAARNSYGRLLAFLASRARDVAAAEDALADAFRSALETWPGTGVPEKPEAWLLVTARRKLIDEIRHVRVQEKALPELTTAAMRALEVSKSAEAFPDERLKLLFICAHPAIEAVARTPLMLQMVLGLDAARIGSAFLVSPTAMGQRLARAKNKILAAGIPFEVPEPMVLPERLDAVLEAIYAAYGSGWDDLAGADPRRKGLAVEALSLGRMLANLMPDAPEAGGLLALMLYCEARKEARRSSEGEYVPLSVQNVELWSKEMIEEAEQRLQKASKVGRAGRFQMEAAIQSVHAQRAQTGRTDWGAIVLLYEGLVRIAPTMGAFVGRAAATSEADGVEAGFTLLRQITEESVQSYQPYWVLAAHLLRRLGRLAEARAAYEKAIGLCEDPAMREFLVQQMQRS